MLPSKQNRFDIEASHYTKSEFNIFAQVPVQHMVERIEYETIAAETSLPSADVNIPLDFKINSMPDSMLDPQITMLLKCQILKKDGSDIDENTIIAPINLFTMR